MSFLRFLVTALAISGASRQIQDETAYVDEIRKEFLDKIQKCRETRDWKGLFDHYQHGLQRYRESVVAISSDQWTGLREVLTAQLSRLPVEAYDFYRSVNDGKARAAFDKAREAGSRHGMEKAVEEFFFSSFTGEVMNSLANLAVDEGRVEEALFHWNRLLQFYPDPSIPHSVLAARIANACLISRNEAALADLRQLLRKTRLEGKVTVAGETLDLARYVESITIPIPEMAAQPSVMPVLPDPKDWGRRRTFGVRNDIRRWVYDVDADRGESPQGAVPLRIQTKKMSVPASGEFPLFPAYTRIRGKEYLMINDGSRVVVVDPARVKGTTSGIYWKYPEQRAILRLTDLAGNGAIGRPIIAVAVEDEHLYVTMVSPLDVRPRDVLTEAQDPFEGMTALKCFHIPSGKLVWDTDARPLFDEMKVVCEKFYDRNFSFSGAPLVQRDRLYVGICTSPSGEQESRVLCLDRKTGRPIWTAFLASLTGNKQWGAQTLLTAQGGMIFVQTNLGVVGAVNQITGTLQWLARYKRTGKPVYTHSGMEAPFFRPANVPFVWKGKVYLLTQDRPEILAYDAVTGKPVELPALQVSGDAMKWKNMRHLVGMIDDRLVIQGDNSYALRLSDFSAYSLASSNSMGTGRGILHDDLIYLPIGGGPATSVTGMLGIYDARVANGLRSWKNIDTIPWKEPNEYGNLLVADRYLIVATNKIVVYTDAETLRSDFAHRIHQSPPHPEALLEFGDMMKENNRLEDAAEAYLEFIRVAEDVSRVDSVRRELHAIFLKRGDEAGTAKALELYAFARKFAWDQKSESEAVRRMAQTCEKMERWEDAVAQYQELIRKGRDLYHHERENVTRLWDHAARRIDAIAARVPESYAEVEKQAAEALKSAREESVEALREVMDLFPNSKSAREAFRKTRDLLFKQGKTEKLRSLYNDFRDRFKQDLNFDSYRELLDLLEKLGDTERLRLELGRFAERFGTEKIGVETVQDYAERRRVELIRHPRAAVVLQGPLRQVGEMEAMKPPVDPGGLSVGHRPLCPLGIVPCGFGPDLELFQRGSSVELWDLRANLRLWARAHPGGYLGVVFGEAGVAVQAVKPGSPAEKAGILKGDLILAVEGVSVNASTLTARLASLSPGATVEIFYRRGERDERTRAGLEFHPPDLRPAIVGASFTRDGSLAVAWEDGVASVDLVTGTLQWTFRAVLDIQGFHATDGRIYVHEANRRNRDEAPFAPDEAPRLYCLSDFTGEVLWARPFDFDPANPTQESQITFFGPYLSDSVRFLQMVSRAGNPEWSLWIIPSSRVSVAQPMKRPLMGKMVAYAVDESEGKFYYVADRMSDQRKRMLCSLSLEPLRKDFKPVEIPLHLPKYMPQHYGICSLAVNREHLVLVVSPSQVGGDHRLWVWSTADGKDRTISLLPERTLPVNQPAGMGIGADGLLYLYNVPREQPTGRAYLTAFRLNATAGGEPVAWDAMAPLLCQTSMAAFTPDGGNYALLTALRASLPGNTGETVVAVVYDKGAEGYVRLRHSELYAPLDGQPPAKVWRGRLYLMARQGMLIFSD